MSTGLPRSVLFVCNGNICRSPYAAGAFERDLPPTFRNSMRIESAGLMGPNRCSPTKAVVVAADRGVDLSAHQSKLLSVDAVVAAGLLVVMNRSQRGTVRRRFQVDRARVIVLGDLDGAVGDGRGIADPVDQPREVFEECYDRIDSCVAT